MREIYENVDLDLDFHDHNHWFIIFNDHFIPFSCCCDNHKEFWLFFHNCCHKELSNSTTKFSFNDDFCQILSTFSRLWNQEDGDNDNGDDGGDDKETNSCQAFNICWHQIGNDWRIFIINSLRFVCQILLNCFKCCHWFLRNIQFSIIFFISINFVSLSNVEIPFICHDHNILFVCGKIKAITFGKFLLLNFDQISCLSLSWICWKYGKRYDKSDIFQYNRSIQ